MPQSAYSQKINAPLSLVWEQLVNKVYHPENFVPGVSDVQILEDGPGSRAVRQMSITTPKGVLTIVEEITWDEATRLVDFRIIEHPSHTGNVINRVDIKTNESGEEELWLTYEMNWAFKGEGADPMEGLIIKGAVVKSIEFIEAQQAKKE